jgi:hypothetical protein
VKRLEDLAQESIGFTAKRLESSAQAFRPGRRPDGTRPERDRNRKFTIQKEVLELLKRHRAAFDKRYL